MRILGPVGPRKFWDMETLWLETQRYSGLKFSANICWNSQDFKIFFEFRVLGIHMALADIHAFTLFTDWWKQGGREVVPILEKKYSRWSFRPVGNKECTDMRRRDNTYFVTFIMKPSDSEHQRISETPPSFSNGHKKEGDKVLMSAKIEDPWPDGRRGGRLKRGEGSDVRWFALQGLQASAVIFYQRMLFKPPPTPSFRLPRTKGGMRLINISSAVSRDEELIQI